LTDAESVAPVYTAVRAGLEANVLAVAGLLSEEGFQNPRYLRFVGHGLAGCPVLPASHPPVTGAPPRRFLHHALSVIMSSVPSTRS
jgi:hypothetical protein